MPALRQSLAAFGLFALLAAPSLAEKKYDPGATDAEITIGNIMPYTGTFSEYGAIGRAEGAYFRMIDDRGGINGRKIRFVSVDDESHPERALDLARTLVERERVLLIFGAEGEGTNLAIRGYLNQNHVPQLFAATPSSKFDDPSHFPWTMGFQPNERTETTVYGRYLLQTKPDAKIGVLFSDDDEGRAYLEGLHAGLGSRTSTMIVKEVSFSYAEPSLDAQLATLKNSGADVFVNLTTGTFATQAIRTAYDLGWHPLQLIPNASLSIAAFLDPAGLEKSVGIITNARSKSYAGPQSQRDPAAQAFVDWMRTYNPDASLRDASNVYGYEAAQTMVAVLAKCGDDLTRDNVLKAATSLDLQLDMLFPGIRVTTSPSDYRPIKQLYLMRFDGKHWVRFGDPIGG